MVKVKLFEGLKNYLPAGVTIASLITNYKLGSKKVLPTISDDLKDGAKRATIFALLIISLYIFIRFRDWRYSLGTIVSLITRRIGYTRRIFICPGIVPFPLKLTSILSRLY
jgi:SecD/SecF fusion protein